MGQKLYPVSLRPLSLYSLAAVLSRPKTAAKNRRRISLHETGYNFCFFCRKVLHGECLNYLIFFPNSRILKKVFTSKIKSTEEKE